MLIQELVCDGVSSIYLKQLGIKQDSIFYYKRDELCPSKFTLYQIINIKGQEENTLMKCCSCYEEDENTFINKKEHELSSAFTFPELERLIPEDIRGELVRNSLYTFDEYGNGIRQTRGTDVSALARNYAEYLEEKKSTDKEQK